MEIGKEYDCKIELFGILTTKKGEIVVECVINKEVKTGTNEYGIMYNQVIRIKVVNGKIIDVKKYKKSSKIMKVMVLLLLIFLYVLKLKFALFYLFF